MSGVRAKCNTCGRRSEDLRGASFGEWHDQLRRAGWIVEPASDQWWTTHYCPSCSAPFAVMLATLACAEVPS